MKVYYIETKHNIEIKFRTQNSINNSIIYNYKKIPFYPDSEKLAIFL